MFSLQFNYNYRQNNTKQNWINFSRLNFYILTQQNNNLKMHWMCYNLSRAYIKFIDKWSTNSKCQKKIIHVWHDCLVYIINESSTTNYHVDSREQMKFYFIADGDFYHTWLKILWFSKEILELFLIMIKCWMCVPKIIISEIIL